MDGTTGFLLGFYLAKLDSKCAAPLPPLPPFNPTAQLDRHVEQPKVEALSPEQIAAQLAALKRADRQTDINLAITVLILSLGPLMGVAKWLLS